MGIFDPNQGDTLFPAPVIPQFAIPLTNGQTFTAGNMFNYQAPTPQQAQSNYSGLMSNVNTGTPIDYSYAGPGQIITPPKSDDAGYQGGPSAAATANPLPTLFAPPAMTNRPAQGVNVPHPLAGQGAINQRAAFVYQKLNQENNDILNKNYQIAVDNWKLNNGYGWFGNEWRYSDTPPPPPEWNETDYNKLLSLYNNAWGSGGAQDPDKPLSAAPPSPNVGSNLSPMAQFLTTGQITPPSAGMPATGVSGGTNSLLPSGTGVGYGAGNGWFGSSSTTHNEGDLAFLRGITQNPRMVDQVPLWNTMLEAMNRQNQQNAGNLNEYFNTLGGRFSTSYGNAMNDYWEQTNKSQNGILAALQYKSVEDALARQLSGAGTLANIENVNKLQQGQFDFQDYLTQLQMAYGASMYNAQMADQAAGTLNAGSQQAANQLLQNAMQAAQLLNQNAVGAAQGMYSGQLSALPAWLQQSLGYASLNNNAAVDLSKLWQSNLGLGNQLGLSQYGTMQEQINRLYQQWQQSSPFYHPYLPYMMQLATGQPSMYTPGWAPSPFSQLAGPLGQLFGGIGSLFNRG